MKTSLKSRELLGGYFFLHVPALQDQESLPDVAWTYPVSPIFFESPIQLVWSQIKGWAKRAFDEVSISDVSQNITWKDEEQGVHPESSQKIPECEQKV